jgi:hypothetical protein
MTAQQAFPDLSPIDREFIISGPPLKWPGDDAEQRANYGRITGKSWDNDLTEAQRTAFRTLLPDAAWHDITFVTGDDDMRTWKTTRPEDIESC